MRLALVAEQNEIARKFEDADTEQRSWLREQLEASDRAFRRLRIREANEKKEAA
jgi:hypothetical protein